MQIWVTVTTNETDDFDMSAQEVADAMFAALGADENKDFCSVSMQTEPPPPALVGKPPGVTEPPPP
jgi:hypothetical protein